jgi:phosphoribosylformimino-5-aminoimidazole carboxamide ribotide isomerase
VRWLEEDAADDAVYGDDPLAQARAFAAAGANWIHVVDLDRAFDTGSDNAAWIRRIAGLERVAVQVGGNVADSGWAREAVAAGASRVVLGMSIGLSDERLSEVLGVVGRERCALAIETRHGMPAMREAGALAVGQRVADVVSRALAHGVRTIVYRDLERDGRLTGVNVAGARRIADAGASVIVAGGVAALDDIRNAGEAGLAGIIVGRALYERRFSLEQAIACL